MSQSTNPQAESAVETAQNESGDDWHKNEKRGSIESPVRTTSPKRSDSPKLTKKSKQDPSVKKNPDTTSSPQNGNTPPAPPPKNNVSKSSSSSRPLPSKTVLIKTHKKGFLESILVALVACCSPDTKHNDEPATSQPQAPHHVNESIEMDILKKEDDRPTTSTSGIPDNEPPVIPLKARDPITDEEAKPSVVIAPNAIMDKDTSTPPRSYTPPQDYKRISTIDHPTDPLTAERELRHSMQIQAPFPPTTDESDAFVVSPPVVVSPQISLQSSTTESEESDLEDIPRPFHAIFEEGQPKVASPLLLPD
jgi:hypothetical protein